MNEKEKQKIKEYYINTVYPDEKSRNEFIEFINAMPEESEVRYIHKSEDIRLGDWCFLDCECEQCKKDRNQIAKWKWEEYTEYCELCLADEMLPYPESFGAWLDKGGE